MNALRVCTWNILHGGGTRRTPEIALAILAIDADVVVLCEYRRRMGGQLRGVLADHGWSHQLCTEPPTGVNGVLIASRLELRPDETGAGPTPQRFLAAFLPGPAVHLAGVHVPDDSRPTDRRACWRRVVDYARLHRADRCLIIGDLNTGRELDGPERVFSCTEFLGLLSTYGYRDAFRQRHPERRESTWHRRSAASQGEAGDTSRNAMISKGFRIDAAHVSSPLSPWVIEAGHLHEPRRSGVSDHSPLVVAFDSGGGREDEPAVRHAEKWAGAAPPT